MRGCVLPEYHLPQKTTALLRALVLLFMVVGCIFGGQVTAKDQSNILDEKSQLEKIQQEVKRSQQKLDSLRNIEIATQQKIANYDQKISTNKKVISRLTRQLKKIRSKLGKTEQELQQKQEQLDRTKRKYLGDIRHFYVKAATRHSNALWESPDAELLFHKQAIYMTSIGAFESEQVTQAVQLVLQTQDTLDKLTGEKHRMTSLKKQKEVATALEKNRKQKKEKTLERLRRKKLLESDRMLTLKQAAEEMERVIDRLERERIARQRKNKQYQPGPSVFATLKGQLIAPFKGKVITPFGHFKDPVTRLESFSPGIIIKGKPGASVRAVAAGDIAHVGNLRGYGNFIIINHDNQYYTTYAGLGETFVQKGEYVSEGTKLAVAGKDGQVRFELRKQREPLDPVKWIRIDSF